MKKIISTVIFGILLLNAPSSFSVVTTVGSTTTNTSSGSITIIPKPVARVDVANAFGSLAVDDNEGNPFIEIDLVTNNTIGSVILSNGVNGRYGYIAGMNGIRGNPGKFTATYKLDINNPAVKGVRDGQTLTDTITYTVTSVDDERKTNTGTLTVTILPPQFKPIAYDDVATVAIDTTKAEASVIIEVKANDMNAGNASIIGSPAGKYGYLDVGANQSLGKFTYKVDLNNSAVRSLKSGESLVETYTYQIRSPGNGTLTSQATITITIIGSTNSAAEVTAVNDTFSLIVDSATTNPSVTYNVLTNDINADKATIVGSTVGQYGSLVGGLTAAGELTYRVNLNNSAVQKLLNSAGVSLSETFSYRANGKAPNDRMSSQGTITVNIVAGNVVPFKAADFVATIVAEAATATTATGTPAANTVAAGTVTGNLKDYNVSLLNLTNTNITAAILSSQYGKYGALQFSSATNTFTYKLNTGVSELQALKNGGNPLQDTFAYSITNNYGVSAQGNIIINIVSNRQQANVHNVEIELNDKSSQATPLNQSIYMDGSLNNGDDRDWYSVVTGGNEILHFDLCPPGLACNTQKAWVMYIFDGDKLTQAMETATVPLYLRRDDGGLTGPNGEAFPVITQNADHMYLLWNSGIFDGALVNVIDPCYGDTTGVDVGVNSLPPGTNRTYYVAISSPLAHDGAASATRPCGDGSVILKKPGPSFDVLAAAPTTTSTTVGNTTNSTTATTKVATTTREYISILPNSDDQYTLMMTRTGVSPIATKASKDEAVYSAVSGTVQIPKIRVNNQLMNVQLQQLPAGKSSNSPMSFSITGTQSLNEPLSVNPYMGTYNPVNNLVQLPKVTVQSTDIPYSVNLQYKPETNTLDYISATPIK